MALPRVKFVDKNLSFQDVFTDVYDGDLDVRVKCRVGFKKPGDAEPKDFVLVDLALSACMRQLNRLVQARVNSIRVTIP